MINKLSFSLSPAHRERLLSLLLMVLILAVYSQVWDFAFIYFDDPDYIIENRHIQNGFTWASISWAFTTLYFSNWHPLTWLSYMLDYQLFGLFAGGYHLMNVFFHIANTLLLFLVLREATGAIWRSFLVAALFGLHPIHVESVAWISERKDVLAAFFWMLTMLAYVRYVKKGDKKIWYGAALLFFILGLMAKPMLVTLPFVLLLLDYWPLKRFSVPDSSGNGNMPEIPAFSWLRFRALLLEKIPFLLLSAASATITYIAQSGAIKAMAGLTLSSRLYNAAMAYVQYLKKLFLPYDLAVLYPHSGLSLPAWQGILAAIFLSVFTFLMLRKAKRYPFLPVGWLWFLGTLIPVIGLVQVGLQSMADRYAYLPFIGLYIGLVWGISALILPFRNSEKMIGYPAMIILGCFILLTWQQIGYWKNSESLLRQTLTATKDNMIAHINLGVYFAQAGNLKEAEDEFNKAIGIKSTHADYCNLGWVYSKKGQSEQALIAFDKSLRLDPGNVTASYMKGRELALMGKKEEAFQLLMTASGMAEEKGSLHDNSSMHTRLGVEFANIGRFGEAKSQFEKALVLAPRRIETLNNMGRLLILLGESCDAIAYLNKAVHYNSRFFEAYNNLGLAHMACGDFEQALYCYAMALHINPFYDKARVNLYRAIQDVNKNIGR
jgi:tetratricopeptide (TPR) repeat protein